MKTLPNFPVPETVRAWILGQSDEFTYGEKPTPVPQKAEVLVRIDAVAICATDLEVIHYDSPAKIRGEGKGTTHRAMALMAAKRFDARLSHTHTFDLEERCSSLHARLASSPMCRTDGNGAG